MDRAKGVRLSIELLVAGVSRNGRVQELVFGARRGTLIFGLILLLPIRLFTVLVRGTVVRAILLALLDFRLGSKGVRTVLNSPSFHISILSVKVFLTVGVFVGDRTLMVGTLPGAVSLV